MVEGLLQPDLMAAAMATSQTGISSLRHLTRLQNGNPGENNNLSWIIWRDGHVIPGEVSRCRSPMCGIEGLLSIFATERSSNEHSSARAVRSVARREGNSLYNFAHISKIVDKAHQDDHASQLNLKPLLTVLSH